MVRRLLAMLLLVTAGVAGGLVLAGRLRSQDEAIAQASGPAASGDAAPQAPAVGTAGPDFTRVAEQRVRAVANISSVQVVRQRVSPFFNDPFFRQFFGDEDVFGSRDRYASSLGSGVVVSADGYVVTNNHVLGEGGTIQQVTVSLADRRELPATVVGVDEWTDLALLKVDATGLPVIPWGDSSKLKVAEWVMAIGNPYQLSQSVSLGIVSALGRNNIGISTYEDFIQTDAAINPGNSGGALVNARGELVGINTAIFTQSGGYQGIGFAVPSNLVHRIVDDLIKYGAVSRGSIGYLEVAPLTSRLAAELGVPSTEGVLITAMRRGTSAARAGIRPGDVIVAFNGQPITDTSQLLRAIADAAIGSTARIDVVRDGRRQSVSVEVERQQPRVRRRG
ncbi:MAG: trypsin-like peptidase domain-containing protein [Acidobacteriota bacterium]